MSKAHKAAVGSKLNSITVHGITYKVGDTAFVKGADSKLPFIGKIKEIRELGKGGPENWECTMAWFYRPEEAEGGRKQFHGEKELFKSEHLDPIAASTMTGKCRVLTLRQYQALEEITDPDFYTRFTYLPAEKEFKPDRVPVYCTCEMPYNPDQLMIMCKVCEEWYHPKCVDKVIEDVEAEEDFICPKRECQNAELGESHMSAEPSAAKSRQAASDPPAAKPKNGVKPVKRKNADA